MGYHRDARHFAKLSAFDGEMRRRVWSTVYQMDLSVSTQLGMPRIVKDSIADAAKPLNLMDSDFGAHSETLPVPRPNGDVTPAALLGIKSEIMFIIGEVSDLITNPRGFVYEDTRKLDIKLQQCHENIPEECRHKHLSHCITDSPQLICQVRVPPFILSSSTSLIYFTSPPV